MISRAWTRRRFIGQGSAAVLASAWAGKAVCQAGTRKTSPQDRPLVRLGAIRVSERQPADPERLAQTYREQGYRAAPCPSGLIGNPRVAEDRAKRVRMIRDAFAKHDVVIAEVSAFGYNMLDPDPAKRAVAVKKVTERLALAEEFGARCCVAIAGTYNPDHWSGRHPDDFSPRFMQEAVANARKIIDAVKPKHTRFTYETYNNRPPDDPSPYVQFVETVDREAFGFHFDPINAIPEKLYGRSTEILNQWFDKLGPTMAACQIRVDAWDMYKQGKEEQPKPSIESLAADGKLPDFTTFLRRLGELPGEVPVIMEHMTPHDYDKFREYLFGLADEAGVRFQ